MKTRARHLIRNEDGAGTVMSLFLCLTVLLLTSGVIDSANAWRARTHLNVAADAAAHAGAVGLAQGMTEADARSFAAQVAAANLPVSIFGDVVADDNNDISFVNWDSSSGALSTTGKTNAVAVKLSRTEANGNPLGTHLLQLVGVTKFDVLATAVAVFDGSADCDGADGIYSEQQITLTSQHNIGPGFCIHSDDFVWLPQNNTFQEGSMVSMPDLDDCKNKCTESANPGINAKERSLLMEDINAWVTGAEISFLASVGSVDATLKDEWFAAKNLNAATITGAANLAPLTDIGYPLPSGLQIGDVITLSSGEFELMTSLPQGFVYNISCDKDASNIPSGASGSNSSHKSNGNSGGNGNGNGGGGDTGGGDARWRYRR